MGAQSENETVAGKVRWLEFASVEMWVLGLVDLWDVTLENIGVVWKDSWKVVQLVAQMVIAQALERAANLALSSVVQ